MNEVENQRRQLHPRVKLDFAHFDGNNPIRRVFKASQYFEFPQIPPAHCLLMASYYMEGKAMI